MISTQLLMYPRNHIYLPHLNVLLYFTPDNHNGELVRRHLLLQTILENHQIPSIPNNLLNHTSHLLPQPPLNPSLISSSRSPTLAFTTVSIIILFPLPRFFVRGVQVVAAEAVGIEGFMVSSSNWSSGSSSGVPGVWLLFSNFDLKKKTETQKQDWK